MPSNTIYKDLTEWFLREKVNDNNLVDILKWQWFVTFRKWFFIKKYLPSTIAMFTGFSSFTGVHFISDVRRSGVQRAKVCTHVQLSLQNCIYTHTDAHSSIVFSVKYRLIAIYTCINIYFLVNFPMGCRLRLRGWTPDRHWNFCQWLNYNYYKSIFFIEIHILLFYKNITFIQ